MSSRDTGEAGRRRCACPSSEELLNFTVVTPNYNMGKYLGETVKSVLRNLRPGDEYFIIDGGSTDDSVDVIRSYESHITGWISERDKSYADALAKGFSRSTADFQCWINSGDLLLQGALDNACKFLGESGVGMIFGDDLYIDELGVIIQVSNGRVANLADMMLYGGWTPLQDACYWRRDLFEKVGGLDPEQKYAADYDLFLRMSLQGECRYVPMIFSAFRQHGAQKSQTGARAYKLEREACQDREINRLAKGALHDLAKTLYYWPATRLRGRLVPRKSGHAGLIGRAVSGIACKPSKTD
jgi:glycosyltransferase involved in cell wall biosynthesis